MDALTTFIQMFVAPAGAGAVSSLVLEQIPAFQGLTSTMKSIVAKVTAAVVALSAYALLTYVPKEYLISIVPVFTVIFPFLSGIIASIKMHEKDPFKQTSELTYDATLSTESTNETVSK